MSKKISKKHQDYYLGLDIGTDSVGWAVTDVDYKLLRVNNKSLWGVRLFDEADLAADRRNFRASRRRFERRKYRIKLLQEIFASVINAADGNFFARLADSNLYGGDKREKTVFSLFSDKDFTDREFHAKYPTVYHLRRAMMTEADPDPRLVYLALHHIVKYRGHFLLEGDGIDVIDDIHTPLNDINAYLDENELPCLDLSHEEDFRQALIKKASKNEKAGDFKQIFEIKEKRTVELLGLIAGRKVKVRNIFPNIESDESITFDCDWDSKETVYEELLGDDYSLIVNAKILYDYSVLKGVLGDHSYISDGMVEKYDKHGKDLAKLKKVIRKYFADEVYNVEYTDGDKVKRTMSAYEAMFKTVADVANYTAYSGKFNFGKKNSKGEKPDLIVKKPKTASYEDFTKYVKSVLEKNPQALADELTQSILTDIDSGTFMPKQVSKSNATLPYQLNLAEMKRILDNAAKYERFKFLDQADADGVTPREKIISLLTFRMPYFVGPTNNTSGRYWIVRKDDGNGKILPWNYESKIDLHATEQAFIDNLTNYCPYVPGAKVLPKCSLLYEEYAFLNIVNAISINGRRLAGDIKNKLSQYYAESGESKLSKKKLKRWLQLNNYISDEDVVIEGFDDGATVHRRMYYQFCKIFGSAQEVERRKDEIEDIIYYATIAGPEKNNLVKYLKSKGSLTDEQIRQIKGLTCKGWGRFSKELLVNRYGMDVATGEMLSVIEVMRSQSLNFQEVYNKEEYGFQNAIEKLKTVTEGNITYKVVDDLYCSPSVKKQIWQTLSIVKEITDILGHAPSKIFVEVARKKQDPKEMRKRSVSRYGQLCNALDALKKENESLVNESAMDRFAECKPDALQNKKLYLYFMQNGIDVYSDENIDYNHLELYDIDHIYPRSKIKDDSLLNNLVLTHHAYNVKKADVFPVDAGIRVKMEKYWRIWKERKLITAEKYKRLTRTTPLTEEEMADFINRQLVETQQSTKEVIGLLKGLYPTSEIVWSKAGNVSDFRAMNKQVGDKRVPQFVKCRELNDLHHAKDAYLNIVVGNVFNVCYGHNARYWLKQNPLGKLSSPAAIYEHDVKNNTITAWIKGADGTIAQVEKTMRSNAVLFTRESKVEKGALFNATLQRKSGNADALVPLKGATSRNPKYRCMSDVSKYGGYTGETRAYYMLVKFVERKETKKGVKEATRYKMLGVTAKDIPLLKTEDALLAYCERNGLLNPEILIPKIKIQTIFEFNGTKLSLSGMTGNRLIWRLAQQHVEDEETERYFKKVIDVAEKYKKYAVKKEEYRVNAFDGITEADNLRLYNAFAETLSSDKYSGAASIVSFAEKISDVKLKTEFAGRTLAEQCVVLAEIAKSLQCNALTSDLTLLKEGKNCGIIYTSSQWDSLDGISIIHRSVTGIFEEKIPLSNFDKIDS